MAHSHLMLYRFTCPSCLRILKAPVQWAGRRGQCPNCQKSVEFPHTALGQGNSWTAEQLHGIIGRSDVPFQAQEQDRLATLLAQATCMEYRMAGTLLAGRKLSARQWRRVLVVAEQRESLRLNLLSHLDRFTTLETPVSSYETGAPMLALPEQPAGAATSQAARHIVLRYLHHHRHGTCPACQQNPTGMACSYRDFPTFLTLAKWKPHRLEKWLQASGEALGLRAVDASPETTIS